MKIKWQNGCLVLDILLSRNSLEVKKKKKKKDSKIFGIYIECTFLEQGITGDVLVNLDHESLRDLSILTVGHRMDLLKNIYQLKIHYRVPVNEWDYIPPSKFHFLKLINRINFSV